MSYALPELKKMIIHSVCYLLVIALKKISNFHDFVEKILTIAKRLQQKIFFFQNV